MRIWTKAPTAAIGVLAILLLLSSACRGVPVEGSIETPESNYQSSVRVGDLPFASNLVNPCPTEPPSSRQGNLVAEERRAEFAVEFYRTIADNAFRYQQDAQNMLDQDVIHDCVSLNLPNLTNTPNLEELQTMEAGDALASIYSSMILHIAHAYYIRHQHQTLINSSCSDLIGNEQNLARKSGELAVKQKFLACIIRMGATAMGYTHNYTTSILNERLTDLRLCSRRALRDCQVLHSSIHLLGAISSYANLQGEIES